MSNLVNAVQVSDGTQFRQMSCENATVMECLPEQGVCEAMLQKYLDKDEDLTPMECFHFLNWAYTFDKNGFKSDEITVEFGQMELK